MVNTDVRRMRVAMTATIAAVLLTLAAACSSSGSPKTSPSSGTGSASTGTTSSGATSSGATSTSPTSPGSGSSATGAPLTGKYYVSVGDSYAAGYQPTSTTSGSTNRNGFAYQLLPLAAKKGYDLTLENFACAGATTTSILRQPGCKQTLLGPGAAPYQGTQAAAAEAFLKAHRGDVALITVSIGGNDVTPCGAASNAVACVTSALATLKKNLATLLTGLRAAAGPTTKIVGITYPDVLLGDELSTDASAKSTAQLSVIAFKSLINPALLAAYTGAGGSFVDVTAATGAYGPMTRTTTLKPYGTIPVPVAEVCTYTFFCQFHDIHPRTNGYALIAGLIAGELPQR